MEPLTISVAETAQALGVSTGTVKGLIRREAVHSIRIGTRRLVDVASVRRLAREGVPNVG